MAKNKIYVATATLGDSVTTYLVLGIDKKDAAKKVKKGFFEPERDSLIVTVDKGKFHKGLMVINEQGSIMLEGKTNHFGVNLGLGKEEKPKKAPKRKIKKAAPKKANKKIGRGFISDMSHS